ncbi:hypothetical protein JCM1841_003248 [Sporobolomyces salmonicolor]
MNPPSRGLPRTALPLFGLFVFLLILWPLTHPTSDASLRLSALYPSRYSSQVSEDTLVPLEDATGRPEAWWRDITIVYSWVNGSEPTYLEDKARFMGKTAGVNRARDDGLFRYSVRSITRYMPWHKGEIVLLSKRNHIPDWIDTTNPRFRHVAEEDIIPQEALPTFDSNIIESYLHRIPGLSNRFLYLNDDFFLARSTPPDTFFTETGGVKLFREWTDARDRQGDDDWTVSNKYTAQLIEDQYGTLRDGALRIPAHAPYAFLRNSLRNLHAHPRFGPALKKTLSHHSRSAEDINVHILHAAYTMFDKHVPSDLTAVVDDKHEARFIAWTAGLEDNAAAIENVIANPPYFFNINDELPSGSAADTPLEQLHGFMDRMYPIPSWLEKSGAGQGA